MNYYSLVKQNAKILLDRTFIGKEVTCFGADGCGKYGRSHFPQNFVIEDVHVSDIIEEDEIRFFDVEIKLHEYDASVCGHVVTDVNLKISVNKLLDESYINNSCWSWGTIEQQKQNSFTIRFTL